MSAQKSAAPAAQRRARESWGSQRGFLMAAIGSAIGLGNIWRFPGVAYENGGGAFILPYLIALLGIGLPILFLDYAIGHKFRGSAPLALARISPKAEVLGWWQVMVSFIILVYYGVILAWAISYAYFSITLAWGDSPKDFFFGEYLQVAGVEDGISFTPVWGIFGPLAAVWVTVLVVNARGIKAGIEAATKVFIPLLVVLFIIVVVHALTLPGATDGLNTLFTPKWEALGSAQVWMAAFAQIFFSMSIAFGIMVTYASYLPKRSNLTGSGLVAGFANSSFELLAGIGVFAALGFMANAQGVAVADLENFKGVTLSFITFPQIISTMPFGQVFGVIFFLCLFLAGITSLMSLVQVVAGAFQDKFDWSPKRASLIVSVLAMVGSLTIFATHTGLQALDTVDAFINSIGVITAAITGTVLVTIGAPMLGKLRRHLNAVSSFKVGIWWDYLIGYVAPAMLTAMFIEGVIGYIAKPYSDYPQWWLAIFGWGTVGFAAVMAVILTWLRWSTPVDTAAVRDLDNVDWAKEVAK